MPLNPATPIYGKTAAGPNEAIGCTTPTAATGVLTFSNQPANGETVTVGPFTYVWTNVTANVTGQTPYYVLIGTNTAGSITNLTAAINGTASKGTLFSNNTRPNTLATAVATSGTILTITATNPGADGNGIATTETMANASWGAGTTTGGVSAALLTSGSGGGSSPAGAPVTINSVAVPQSTTGSIPIGAKGWTFTVLAGTATFNGVAALPAGFSESDVNTLAAAISYTTASASTAYVRYNS